MDAELFRLPLGQVFLAGLIIFLAAFLQSFAGFGFVLLAIPLLTLTLGGKMAVPLVACTAFINASIVFSLIRQRARYREIGLLLLGALFAVPLGVCFLSRTEEGTLRIVLAAVIAGYSLFTVARKARLWMRSQWWAVPFGVLSGFLGGAAGAAAPPVIIYAQLAGWDKDTFKVSLALYLIATTATIIVSHYMAGLSGPTTFMLAFIFTPVMFVASRAGIYVSRYISNDLFSRMIHIILFILAGLLVYNR